MSNISTTKKSFILFLIFQMIYARASSSPSNEELSGKHAGHDPLGHGARQAVLMHCIPRIAHPRSLASCCDRIHLVGSSSGAIHPPGKSIHASKHPCTVELGFPPGSHWPAGLLTWLWLAAPFCHLPLRPARVSISGMRAGYIIIMCTDESNVLLSVCYAKSGSS